MDHNSTEDYLKLLNTLAEESNNITRDTLSSLLAYSKSTCVTCGKGTEAETEDRYSKPMFWIGLYIALASLCCILAMVADLVHGLRSRKLWFPCKYFSVNAASLSVIAVAMKLPVDLSGAMPGDVDQAAKLGSLAFMCTMMANLLPCLAVMDNNELLTNIIALGVLVITLVVNVCIQIQTGVISENAMITSTPQHANSHSSYSSLHVPGRIPTSCNTKNDYYKFVDIKKLPNATIATMYMTLLVVMLIIHVCSSLTILKSKQIIESKYQQRHGPTSKDLRQSTGRFLTVEKIQEHVSHYWIMARSGSPQFIIACFPTTTASGVICGFTTILHTLTLCWAITGILRKDCGSDYKWSTLVILLVQYVGVVLGTVAPLSRCFATLSFKVCIKSILTHIKVFKVEKYWTQKLYDWKYSIIPFPFQNRKLKVIITNLKGLILNISIKLQEGVVVVCKIIALIPFCFMICFVYCLRCFKCLLQQVFSSWGKRTENLEQREYVLQHDDENELAGRTLEGLLKSLNRLIRKNEEKQPNNLMNLIKEKSTIGFQGVKMFDNNNNDHDHVQCSPSKGEYQDCWSLSVVTLTTIAIALPNLEKVEVKSLMRSVREGLKYITLIEENFLNATNDYASIQKAAKILWEEVDFRHKWLGINLKDIDSQVNTTTPSEVDTTPQMLHLFLEMAKNKIDGKVERTELGGADRYSECISICAYSMRRITEKIIEDKECHKKLFDELSSRIADIMVACLTNLPQVIAIKSHTSVIEKRVASVQVAAQLLGETKEIIKILQDPLQDKWHAYLSISPDDLPFIDKWPAYLSEP